MAESRTSRLVAFLMLVVAATVAASSPSLVPPHEKGLAITSEVVFSSLDGSAADLDGTVNGVLVLRGLEIKDDGALLIDVPSAGILVAKDVKLSKKAAIRPVAISAAGPAIAIEAGHKIELGDDSVVSADGRFEGGSVFLGAERELKIKKNARVSADSSADTGGRIHVRALRKLEIGDKARLTAAGDKAGGTVLIRAGHELEVKKEACVHADSANGMGGTVHFQSFQKVELADKCVITANGATSGGEVFVCATRDLKTHGKLTLSADATGTGGTGGKVVVQCERKAKIEHDLTSASGDNGGSVTFLSCGSGKDALAVKGSIEAIGKNGTGGTVDLEARAGSLEIKDKKAHIDAKGTIADGEIVLQSATTIKLESTTSPAPQLLSESPSSKDCACRLSSVLEIDLAGQPASLPRDAIGATGEALVAAQGTYPSLAGDLQLIKDELQSALADGNGESLFSDPCHVVAATGPGVFDDLLRGMQRVQRLLPWDEIWVDPGNEGTPAANTKPVPESLRRVLATQLTAILQSCALLADVAIQEARGEDKKAAKSADKLYDKAITAIRDLRFYEAARQLQQAWATAVAVVPAPKPAVGDRPILSILTPGPGASVSESTTLVTGMVQDIVRGTVNHTEVGVVVNGVPADVVNRSYLASGVKLRNGLSAIVAVGTDLDGNRVTFCRAVTVNPTFFAQLEVVSGNNQIGQIQSTLPGPLVVQVMDTDGQPLGAAQVVFRMIQGNGSLGASRQRSVILTTGTDGLAQTSLNLGTRVGVGVDRVRATAAGILGEAIFCAQATGLPPDSINPVMGDNQRGAVGQALADPLIVVVTDPGMNPLAGVPVTFKVTEGGGTIDDQASKVVNTNSNGRAEVFLTLGPAAGLDNNLVEASFPGLAKEPVTFKASGFVLGDPAATRVSGVVLDNSSQPVPGVTLRIKNTDLKAIADAAGQFTIHQVPVGKVHLVADATTTTRPGTWASLEFELTTLPGIDNTLPKPIYILPLDLASGKIAGGDEDVTITVPGIEGLSMTVLAHSVTFPGGGKTGIVSVTPVTSDKIPMNPGSGMQPRVIVTIQPAGAHFDPPAPVTFPNVDGMPPGTVAEMFSFDHDLGEFVSIGTGTVSSDGRVVRSDPGFGIVKAGWHCSAPQSQGGASAPLEVSITNKDPIVLCKGDTVMITANGSPPRDGEYKWETSDAGVVSISPSGGGLCANASSCSTTAKAVSGGSAKVTVTFKCTTTGKTVTDTIKVIAVAVDIGDVERGTGLPKSLPPTKTFDVDVTITPSLAGTGHSITFDVVNGSAANGTASVTANTTRTTTGKITIKGGTQTTPGNAGKLKIRARLDATKDCEQSNGFSVCAHPSEIGFNFNSILSPFIYMGSKFWGAEYDLKATSDSGTLADLDKTKVSENVIQVSATGYYIGATSSTSGFITTTSPQSDHHASGGFATAAAMIAAMDAAGNTGTRVVHQFFRFSCERCNIAESKTAGPKVPKSGFKVTRSISKEGTKHFVNVKKEGLANNGVAAGAVNDTAIKKAEVKD